MGDVRRGWVRLQRPLRTRVQCPRRLVEGPRVKNLPLGGSGGVLAAFGVGLAVEESANFDTFAERLACATIPLDAELLDIPLQRPDWFSDRRSRRKRSISADCVAPTEDGIDRLAAQLPTSQISRKSWACTRFHRSVTGSGQEENLATTVRVLGSTQMNWP